MIDHERWWTSELVHVFVGKGKKTLGEFPIHFVLNTVLKWQMLRWCWDAKYPLSWQDRFRFQWHWGINNGVWILKNTAWSHRFLETWWRSDILQGPGQGTKVGLLPWEWGWNSLWFQVVISFCSIWIWRTRLIFKRSNILSDRNTIAVTSPPCFMPCFTIGQCNLTRPGIPTRHL